MSVVPVWLCGVFICLFGSTLTALGLVLQKHSQRGRTAEEVRRYWRSPRWLCGLLIFVSAQLINMVSMAITPQVVLSCLGSWTLVCNTCFARLILQERVGRAQGAAVAGVMASMAMVVYNAPRPGHVQLMQTAELAGRFASPEFLALSLAILGLSGAALGVSFGVSFGCGGKSEQSDPEVAKPEAGAAALVTRTLEPTSWAMTAAVAAGYTALLFKCIAEIIAGASKASPPPWWCWETYAIFASGMTSGSLELHCLNLALQKGEAVLVVPSYLALGMVAQMLTGGVFFQELRNFDNERQAACFALSVLLTLAFVVGMAVAQETDVQETEVAKQGDHRPMPLVISVDDNGIDQPLIPEGSTDIRVRPPPLVPDLHVAAAGGPSTPTGQPALLSARGARPARVTSVAGFGCAVQLAGRRGRATSPHEFETSRIRGQSAPAHMNGTISSPLGGTVGRLMFGAAENGSAMKRQTSADRAREPNGKPPRPL